MFQICVRYQGLIHNHKSKKKTGNTMITTEKKTDTKYYIINERQINMDPLEWSKVISCTPYGPAVDVNKATSKTLKHTSTTCMIVLLFPFYCSDLYCYYILQNSLWKEKRKLSMETSHQRQ